MLDFDINYTSLQQAISDLTSLKEDLSSGSNLDYSDTNFIDTSKGGTCDEINKIYSNMVKYQLELIKLTTLTESIAKNISTAFSDAEVESAQESMQLAD